MKLADRLKKAAGLAVLPATVLTATVLPISAAQAQTPAASMKVLTPRQNETLGTNRFNLDVRFESFTNAPIITAELWVDGVRWVHRDLDSPRRASVLSFLVDGSTLSAGSHLILVKVFNGNGDTSVAKLNVIAGSDEAQGEAAWGGPEVQFVNPGNGKKVSGTIELLVDAKSRNGQSPYVTFYVDKQFKTLKNYPPYTLTWDTTTVSNGVHEIEAAGYLDSSNATTTRRIRVFVDNPGGNTRRMSEIPDLSRATKAPVAPAATPAKTVAKVLTIPLPKKTEAPVPVPTGEARMASSTAGAVAVADSLGLADTTVAATAAKTAAPRLSAPNAPTFATAKPVVAKSVAPAPKVAATAKPTVIEEPTLSPTSDVVALDVDTTVADLADITVAAPKASLAAPRLSRPVMPVARTVVTVKPVVAPVAVPAVRVAPVMPVVKATASISAPAAKPVVARVAAPERVSVAAPKVAVAPAARAARRTDSMKPILVAFDGERIAFDVQPRVEAGMPIAPFRQIFEHTGGRVSWAQETQTVHAVNANREIVIGVGKKTAKVNGESITMDRAASLERGRTVVPLNFVGKALDVNVQYDPATGRLSITSKN